MTQKQGVEISLDELIKLRHQANTIRLKHKKAVASDRMGSHQSRLRGRGVDFDEVRVYQPGDDIRNMDWRVTARTGKPHTKLYHDERERPVFLLVDYGPTMFFGTKVAFKSVIAAQIASLLGWCAVNNGDQVGSIIFSGTHHTELPPTSRAHGILAILRVLADRKGPQSLYPKTNAMSKALLKLRRVVRPGSLIFIISDFFTFNDECKKQLSQLRQHNEVIATFVYDPLEKHPPPPDRYTISNGREQTTINTHDEAFCKAYRENFINRYHQLKTALNQLQIPLTEFSTSKSVLDNFKKGRVWQ